MYLPVTWRKSNSQEVESANIDWRHIRVIAMRGIGITLSTSFRLSLFPARDKIGRAELIGRIRDESGRQQVCFVVDRVKQGS